MEKDPGFRRIKEYASPAVLRSVGVGKTTLSLVIARELFGEHWRENTLELNASDERGIDVVRVKVKDFARTKALGEVPFKLIYLDESDALTREAQASSAQGPWKIIPRPADLSFHATILLKFSTRFNRDAQYSGSSR